MAHSRSRNSSNFNGTFEHDPASCDTCMAGFPRRASQQFTYFGQRLPSDLCGPFPVSVDGWKHALVIVDAAICIRSVSLQTCGLAEPLDCHRNLIPSIGDLESCGHRRIRNMLTCDACMAGFGPPYQASSKLQPTLHFGIC